MYEKFRILEEGRKENFFIINNYQYDGMITNKVLADITYYNIKNNLSKYNLDKNYNRKKLLATIDRRKNEIGIHLNNGTDAELFCAGFLKFFLMHEIWGEKISLSEPDKGYDVISFDNNNSYVNISEVKSNLPKRIAPNAEAFSERFIEAFKSIFCDQKIIEDQQINIDESFSTERENWSNEKNRALEALLEIEIPNRNQLDISYQILNDTFTINIFSLTKYTLNYDIFHGFEKVFHDSECVSCNKVNNCKLLQQIKEKSTIINLYYFEVENEFNLADYFKCLEDNINGE